jgi:hypothetical protein
MRQWIPVRFLFVFVTIGWLATSPSFGQLVPAKVESPPPNPPVEDPDDTSSPLAKSIKSGLTDPAELERLEREKNRPPIEFFKSSILPNDVLPYIKANHWSTLALELRANHVNFNGTFETQPVGMTDMPHEVIFRRDIGLVKGQRSRILLQMMTPVIPREIRLRLEKPESLIPDEYLGSLRVLEPHQMLIAVLSKGPNDAYGRWNQLPMMFPLSAAKTDPVLYDKQRYYRMVLPTDPDHPPMPGHPLTWSTISHVIWDGMSPETLSPSQQDAMLDWLHWGGQLIFVGGAGPNYAALRESFIEPFLPAESLSEATQLDSNALAKFAEMYAPPAAAVEPDEPIEGTQRYDQAFAQYGRRYRNPVPLVIPKSKPLYFAKLKAKPGAREIGLGDPGLPPLGVEWRVGRGRILMLSVAINDPVLVAWPGYSTLLRRVVLRRPEEHLAQELGYSNGGAGGYAAPRYDTLNGPDLTWFRLYGRDLGAPARQIQMSDESDGLPPKTTEIGAITVTKAAAPRVGYSTAINPTAYSPYQVPVAEWVDSAALPVLSRDKLKQASGIEIPARRFVLIVIVAYIIALVPINWLISRYALGRREWAWVFVPILALGFAYAVERAAAYDVGYDSACNEIDVIETFGDFQRAHLNRFASLYTTGRVQYTVAYPGEPSAVALPLNPGKSLRGQDVQQSIFQATPTPMLTNFQVQPRSLAMFRAEQFMSLPGSIRLVESEGKRKVVNNSAAVLRDAVLIEVGGRNSKIYPLGRIESKGEVDVSGSSIELDDYVPPKIEGLKKNQVDPANFLDLLVKSSIAMRPEDLGEVRLIAWSDTVQGGQVITPAVDLHQGFTAIVAHLKVDKTPDPDSPRYNILANGPEEPSKRMLNTPPPPVYPRSPFTRVMPLLPGQTPTKPALPPPPPGAMPAKPDDKAKDGENEAGAGDENAAGKTDSKTTSDSEKNRQ